MDFLPFSFVIFRWHFEGKQKYNITEKRELGVGRHSRKAMKKCLPAAMSYSFISGLRSRWAGLDLEYWYYFHLWSLVRVTVSLGLNCFPCKMEISSLSCPPCCTKSPQTQKNTLQLQPLPRIQSNDCMQVCGLAYKSQLNPKGSWNAILWFSTFFYYVIFYLSSTISFLAIVLAL